MNGGSNNQNKARAYRVTREKNTNGKPGIKTPRIDRKNLSGDFIKPTDLVRVKGGVDRPMFLIIMILLCFGTVMIFSASFAYALYDKGDSYYYFKRQILFALVGLLAMIFIMNVIDYRLIQKFTVLGFLITCGLLAIVPIYGLSKGVATRWIQIGSIRFQPSELMKIVLVLMLAYYMAKFQSKVTDYRNFWKSSTWGVFIPIGIVGFVCMLIALENHFSGMIIMFLIGMFVIFAGGARKIWFVLAGSVGTLVIGVGILLSDYARERLDSWIHPENYSAQDEIWQTLQGLNAVGSGGLLGVGLGNSRQKHLYVSEPQNDFIFSIICEELGFIGAIAVVVLFALFLWRGFVIALRAPDTFSSLVAIGITCQVVLQAVLNVMVVTALIPNTGISLPFFSYGGTALIMLLAEMGILLGISRYSYQEK